MLTLFRRTRRPLTRWFYALANLMLISPGLPIFKPRGFPELAQFTFIRQQKRSGIHAGTFFGIGALDGPNDLLILNV
ncbi:Uncharacterised protein [Salmonella enterica subsp. enterica serovar Bovismorbificans]|uniref:Uncharacterized protein n=1 Tax=Salmonella enterica subsp. enterica serovar Bovismorbificans TaxID=58097 RepID=A0A655DKG2_SALET|nr:Uncharacterised protein [Salmonella enterica subsp. enterica serovar Bovismorbificans]